MKKYICFVFMVCLMLLAGCADTQSPADASIADKLLNENNEYVLMVKNAEKSEYPGTTYGKAFAEFFGDPAWRHFKSDENKDCVEFTGTCTYQEVEVNALMQFSLDLENGTFEIAYLSFNDVPQNKMILAALIEKAFEESVPRETLMPETTPTPVITPTPQATEEPTEDITAGSAKADDYSEMAVPEAVSESDAVELVRKYAAEENLTYHHFEVSPDSNSEFWLIYGMDVEDGDEYNAGAYKVYIETGEVVSGPTDGPLDRW